ncbi:immunity protein YezG family protein [Gracilibacillus suaedae]|uniref:immunity protein YezG family protein n=1 Tax=Gracilibacillus suaedae TaxID=2820273 RepID=UPI001ABDE095|nr:immunity protein YezG family protein [Gracilibacillus suaedae]
METKKMEQTYQQIANTLVNIVPEEWERILLYAEYREGYRKIFFYYYPQTGIKPVYSLDIIDFFNIEEEEYDQLEDELYECFTMLWEEFKEQGQEQWTNLTFILDNTGKMKIDYGYEDISEISPVEKQDRWEAKYLK